MKKNIARICIALGLILVSYFGYVQYTYFVSDKNQAIEYVSKSVQTIGVDLSPLGGEYDSIYRIATYIRIGLIVNGFILIGVGIYWYRGCIDIV